VSGVSFVEVEQHFIFDCAAYSHISNKQANLFQQTNWQFAKFVQYQAFITKCEPNACVVFSGNAFLVGSAHV